MRVIKFRTADERLGRSDEARGAALLQRFQSAKIVVASPSKRLPVEGLLSYE